MIVNQRATDGKSVIQHLILRNTVRSKTKMSQIRHKGVGASRPPILEHTTQTSSVVYSKNTPIDIIGYLSMVYY